LNVSGPVRLTRTLDSERRKQMSRQNLLGVSLVGVVSILCHSGTAFAQEGQKVPYIPETSVAVFSLFMILIGMAIFALLGAFLVKLATSWVCGESASYKQGYKTFFLANVLSSICIMSGPMLLESITKTKLHPIVMPIGAVVGLATWPLIYGKLISIGGGQPIGVKKGIFVSLIMAVVNGIVFLAFGGPSLFTK
jgi:hypothetical protein